MNSVILQNVPGLPSATVANCSILWEPQEGGLETERKAIRGVSSRTAEWYFVLQESTASKLRRIDHGELMFFSLTHFFFYSLHSTVSPVSHNPPKCLCWTSYRLLSHKLKTEAYAESSVLILWRWPHRLFQPGSFKCMPVGECPCAQISLRHLTLQRNLTVFSSINPCR